MVGNKRRGRPGFALRGRAKVIDEAGTGDRLLLTSDTAGTVALPEA